MHDSVRTANLLGATALAVTDLALGGATGATGLSASAAAALAVLSTAPGLSVTELGRRVGLSQPAAARMVDGLEAARLVTRRPGGGRTKAVRPTTAGRRAARTVLAARAAPLTAVLDALDEREQHTLDTLLTKLLTRLYQEIGSADLMCRLCERARCTRGAVCPVGAAERG